MAFATSDDVASRLGRALGANEVAPVAWLLDAATAVLADAAGKDDTWAAALTPVPTIVKSLCVELVCRALANPQALNSMQEGLGAHNFTVRFGAGLMLTPIEERIVSRAIFGAASGSSHPESIVGIVDTTET